MKEYFISVIAVSLVGSIIVSMASANGTGKYLKLLCGLCTVACIVVPLTSAFGMTFEKENVLQLFEYETSQEEDYEEIYNSSLNKYEIENAEIALKNNISKDLRLDRDDFDVDIITDEKYDEIYISTVRVNIYSSGISIDPNRIRNWIYDSLNCGCEIVYDI